MKRTLLILTLFLISNHFIYSQYGWYQQSSGTNNNLNCIGTDGWNPASKFWICGNSGIIIKSTNSGTTWIGEQSGTNNNLNSVRFFYSNTGFAAGDNGTILKSVNGGQIWNPLSSGITNKLNDIDAYVYDYMLVQMNLWAVGDGGKILFSSDVGYTWQQQNSGTTFNLHSMFISDSSNVLICGDNGVILRTSNSGASWFVTYTGYSGNLNFIFRDYVNYRLICCGSGGTILYSTDMGNTWEQIISGTNSNLSSITRGLYTYIAGDSGVILKTTNQGSNWIQQTSNTNVNLHSVLFIDDNTGWAVGDNGTIVHTTTDVYAITINRLNAHTISSGFSNAGLFNCDVPINTVPGFEWPKGSGMHARYGSGLWIGANIGTDTIVSSSDMNFYELPGYTDNGGFPHGCNDPQYRVYKLSFGVNDSDRSKWPNALLGNSDQGAPVYFDAASNSWKPIDFGEQTIFYTYTDSYLLKHSYGDTLVLKADVKQLDYTIYFPAISGDVLISQFTIINRNIVPWNNTFITVHTDDDLGDPPDDVTGCDTVLQMGYTYNGVDYDAVYGNAPPAVSFNLLKGPSVFTGNNNDTDFICSGRNRIYKTGYKQMKLSSFNNYHAYEDPYYDNQQYCYMAGLDIDGNPRINPITGLETKFMFTGDPETGQGWVQQNLDDQRFMISMGPFTMNPGDTQTVVVAQVIARGTDYKNSVTKLKQFAQIVRASYLNCFSDVPISVNNSPTIPLKYSLSQNFPNPFNPKTSISYQLAKTSNVKIIVYDILGREVSQLVNTFQNAGTYKVDWDGSNFASGVYFYRLTAGDPSTGSGLSFTDVKKMVLIK